jgi:hypothetical protein
LFNFGIRARFCCISSAVLLPAVPADGSAPPLRSAARRAD